MINDIWCNLIPRNFLIISNIYSHDTSKNHRFRINLKYFELSFNIRISKIIELTFEVHYFYFQRKSNEISQILLSIFNDFLTLFEKKISIFLLKDYRTFEFILNNVNLVRRINLHNRWSKCDLISMLYNLFQLCLFDCKYSTCN